MTKLAVLLALVAATTAATGCKKGGGSADKAKYSALCVESDKQMASSGSGVNADTFQMQLSNVMQTCALGCDAADDPSCKTLDKAVTALCSVTPSICDQLCTGVKSASLKKAACSHGTKK